MGRSLSYHLRKAAEVTCILLDHRVALGSLPPYNLIMALPLYHTGSSYHTKYPVESPHSIPPHCLGKIEKANSILKTQLTKLPLQLHMDCISLLPQALTGIQPTPWAPTFLSPFELEVEQALPTR